MSTSSILPLSQAASIWQEQDAKDAKQLDANLVRQLQDDTVNLSVEARASFSRLIPPANLAAVSKPIEAYTSSGHKVTVYNESFFDDSGEQQYRLLAQIDKLDGARQTYDITANTVINEDESGNIVVNSGKGPLKGSAGNDVIINFDAFSIEAGDGDNTIINLNSSLLGVSINAGSGNNKIIADQLILAKINLGDGNNTLTTNFMAGDIVVGDGNNILNVGDYAFGEVRTGAGQNQIIASSIGGSDGPVAGGALRLASGMTTSAVTINGGSGTTSVVVENDAQNLSVNGSDGGSVAVEVKGNLVSSFFEGINLSLTVGGKTIDSYAGRNSSLAQLLPEFIEGNISNNKQALMAYEKEKFNSTTKI